MQWWRKWSQINSFEGKSPLRWVRKHKPRRRQQVVARRELEQKNYLRPNLFTTAIGCFFKYNSLTKKIFLLLFWHSLANRGGGVFFLWWLCPLLLLLKLYCFNVNYTDRINWDQHEIIRFRHEIYTLLTLELWFERVVISFVKFFNDYYSLCNCYCKLYSSRLQSISSKISNFLYLFLPDIGCSMVNNYDLFCLNFRNPKRN